MKEKDIIIRGYYGRDNLGDEIMLEVFYTYLSQIYNTDNIKFMNSSPDDIKQRFGIETPVELQTGKIPNFRLAIKRFLTIFKSEIYIVGGGTILTDKHSYLHMIENALYFFARKIFGKKNYLVSVGATEFRTRIGEFVCGFEISFATKVYLRDKLSYEFIASKYKKKNLVLSGDLVYLAREIYPDEIQYKEVKEVKSIGLCMMPYYEGVYKQPDKDEDLIKELVTCIHKMEIKKNRIEKIYLIPIQNGYNNQLDLYFMKKIKDKLNIECELIDDKTVRGKISALAKCDLIISMRLHALLIGLLNGSKIVAIDHNEKIQELMRIFDLNKYSLKLQKINCLDEIVNELLETPTNQIINNRLITEGICNAKKNFEFIDDGLGV